MSTAHMQRSDPPEPTFGEIVAEYAARHDSSRAIAEAIFVAYGWDVFRAFGADWAISVLAEKVRTTVARSRSKSITTAPCGRAAGTGSVIGGCRVALSKGYWAKLWIVDGRYVATRDLTLAHLQWLIEDRTKVSTQARAQILFFETNAQLAKRHRVKVLGDLERKGIDLLEVETIDT